jgi:hypothetical protein
MQAFVRVRLQGFAAIPYQLRLASRKEGKGYVPMRMKLTLFSLWDTASGPFLLYFFPYGQNSRASIIADRSFSWCVEIIGYHLQSMV